MNLSDLIVEPTITAAYVQFLVPALVGLVSALGSTGIQAGVAASEADKRRKAQEEANKRADQEARKPKFKPFEPVDMAALTQTRNLDPGGGATGGGAMQYQMEALRRMRS